MARPITICHTPELRMSRSPVRQPPTNDPTPDAIGMSVQIQAQVAHSPVWFCQARMRPMVATTQPPMSIPLLGRNRPRTIMSRPGPMMNSGQTLSPAKTFR